MQKELSDALDDLILGRGVARGRHALTHQGRDVSAEFVDRLRANGFRETTVRDAPIEAGEKIPGFVLDKENGLTDFGWIRWEIFTPRSRRKLFASERRRTDNQEWAIQLSPSSAEPIWANAVLKERHDVDTVVPVNP